MRLIDADEAVELLSEWDWQEAYLPCHFKELILDVCDTVDAEPVKHGHWGVVKTTRDGIELCGCTSCGFISGISKPNWGFCPNCGAKMDEEAGGGLWYV